MFFCINSAVYKHSGFLLMGLGLAGVILFLCVMEVGAGTIFFKCLGWSGMELFRMFLGVWVV